jgi:Na+-driven multidrug efflux pump
VGTTEANAFVVVNLLTWITSTLNYGFCETLGKTIPIALGEENNKLAGIYLNTSMTLYTIGIIPIAIIWSLLSRETLLWLGFDDTTAQMAQDFAYLQVMLEWVTGIDYCFHLFLDVTGHEKYSTVTMFIYNIGQTLGVVVPVLAGKKGLIWVGVCRVAFSILLVFGNGVIILFLGWIEPFSQGFLTVPLSVSFFFFFRKMLLLSSYMSKIRFDTTGLGDCQDSHVNGWTAWGCVFPNLWRGR